MLTADGRVAISFNGEIYNYRELRADLQAKGFAFRTESDTEVLLAAWRQWGPKCLPHLDGMFAFALYDLGSDSLFLARDRLGAKPLFYSQLADGALIFASELKGLLAHPLFRPAPDPQAIDDYLALGYVPEDACLVAGVRKLGAGHYLLVRRGRPVPKPVRWWDLDFTNPVSTRPAALEEELLHLVRQAVRSRMVADVPVGAWASGEIESSAVVAFMAEASRNAVETCSIGFAEDSEANAYAALVAERFATNHRTRTVAAADFSPIDTLAQAFDEPFADASALGAFRAAELARERVKVALSDAGADEAFAGHARYRTHMAEERARGLMPASLQRAAGAVGSIYPKLNRAPQPLRARGKLQALGQSSEAAYANAVALTPADTRAGLYRGGFFSALEGERAEDRYARMVRDAPADDPLSRAQYADLRIWLPGSVLTKLDRTSMAVGLEAREPMLDHRLVEFAARLPARMRLRGSTGKWLMRRALERHLPPEILKRRDKPFVPPVGAWFRGPLAGEGEALARGSALAELGWFDEAALSRLGLAHRAGKADHGRLLWQLLMLECSLQKLFGLGRSPSYRASTKYSPSGGALKPSAARSRA
jgi:asparagine synthase (glutamine-hydrolysing)